MSFYKIVTKVSFFVVVVFLAKGSRSCVFTPPAAPRSHLLDTVWAGGTCFLSLQNFGGNEARARFVWRLLHFWDVNTHSKPLSSPELPLCG